MKKQQYYGDYLGLPQLLDAQHPESRLQGNEAHDELLFIIIHQAYELWFKQLLHELDSIREIFQNQTVDDNSSALQTVTHRLGRMVEIWKLLIEQVRVLETMTAMDFLDFRDLLTPASGFQSIQFRILEAGLGLKMEARHQTHYYEQQLRADDLERVRKAESQTGLFELLDAWLGRIPFWDVDKYWGGGQAPASVSEHPFWADFRQAYAKSLSNTEQKQIGLESFEQFFFEPTEGKERPFRLSAAAARASLFITLYRDYPLLQQPFQLLSKVLEIDELMATWRYRHWIMVRRMIGLRAGTGGSSGAGYLKGAMESHHVFNDFARIATFLLPRQQLPTLPKALETRLGFLL